jgi:hypothetical protein
MPAALAIGEKLHLQERPDNGICGVETYGKDRVDMQRNLRGEHGWEWTGVLG